ncbi:hypothetical protein EON73_01010 [bacterium]|nr:MAG: hypothetical protein EON73_01010 [bacterium]
MSYWFYLVWKKKYQYFFDGQFLHLSFLVRFYSFLGDNRGLNCIIGVDSNFFSSVYHGAYGFISTFYSLVSLPCYFCYEELNVLFPPVSVVSFKVWAAMAAQTLKETTETSFLNLISSPSEHDEKVKAVFQVSPLQKLISA